MRKITDALLVVGYVVVVVPLECLSDLYYKLRRR